MLVHIVADVEDAPIPSEACQRVQAHPSLSLTIDWPKHRADEARHHIVRSERHTRLLEAGLAAHIRDANIVWVVAPRQRSGLAAIGAHVGLALATDAPVVLSLPTHRDWEALPVGFAACIVTRNFDDGFATIVQLRTILTHAYTDTPSIDFEPLLDLANRVGISLAARGRDNAFRLWNEMVPAIRGVQQSLAKAVGQ